MAIRSAWSPISPRYAACWVADAMSPRALRASADRHVAFAVVADLCECDVEKPREGHRRDTMQHSRRAVQVSCRGLARDDPHEYAAELIDATDRGARVVYRRGDRLQRDVDQLQHAELDVLLHRAHDTDVEGADRNSSDTSGGMGVRAANRKSGFPGGMNCPTRRWTTTTSPYSLASERSRRRRCTGCSPKSLKPPANPDRDRRGREARAGLRP